QRVIVNNRPREGGMSGIHEMTRAQPDGYTVGFVWNSPLTVTPLTVRAPYEKRDYRAVMSIGFSSYVLCARPDFPADDATALIEHLVANPGLYSYGNDGAGGTMRLAAERIFRSAGAELRGVPFSGATETARNFLAGQVDFYGGSLAAILPHVESGQAKCLILTSADDNPAMPAASGLRALGLEHAETVLWWGMIAPAGVPDDDVARLEAAFLAAAESEPFIADMIRRGAVPRARGAIETDAMIESEIAAFREIVATQ
ncbi:MAG: tripartite tricarboxylate transporter substrate binding protein, partial [Salinarimonadaceae bacterium]